MSSDVSKTSCMSISVAGPARPHPRFRERPLCGRSTHSRISGATFFARDDSASYRSRRVARAVWVSLGTAISKHRMALSGELRVFVGFGGVMYYGSNEFEMQPQSFG
jgi:hypothetical protein